MKAKKSKMNAVKGIQVAVFGPNNGIFKSLVDSVKKLGCNLKHDHEFTSLMKSCKQNPAKVVFVAADFCEDYAAAVKKNQAGIENVGTEACIIVADEGQIDFGLDWAQQLKCYLVTEPLVTEELSVLMERALDAGLAKHQLSRYESTDQNTERFGPVVARSEEMKEVVRVAKILATREDPILFIGAVGTGKEILAKTIHEHSARRHGPFYSINCRSFSNEDLMVEIFGKDDGDSDDKSLLELCSDGTLFLDEVNEISPALQGKLQRFLEDKTYTKVNSRKVFVNDVRICAGTSVPLSERVAKGDFSEELFFYLNRFTLHVPSLRRRVEDIPVLTEVILKEAAKAKGVEKISISEDALKLLVEYNWSGNVRELRNALEYATLVAEDNLVEAKHLPKQFHDEVGSIFVGTDPEELPPLDEIERQYIMRVMDACRGNKVKAAHILEVNRATLHRKLQIYEAQKKRQIL